jgi:hypothetical protein
MWGYSITMDPRSKRSKAPTPSICVTPFRALVLTVMVRPSRPSFGRADGELYSFVFPTTLRPDNAGGLPE